MKKRLLGIIMALIMVMGSGAAVTATGANSNYIVYNQTNGKAKTGAMDYSWMNETPAGKHGSVLVKGDGFEFEDGTPVKFFGVVLGFGAATPDKDVAEAMAADLASLGVNMVRIHAIDCTYSGVLTYQNGKKTAIDPNKIAKMDYLIYCLKQKGIYIHLDTNAGRVLTTADGFSSEEVAAGSSGALRATRFFDENVIKLEQQFSLDLLKHVNSYTKLSYAKDPVIAIVQYANESSITWYDSPNPDTVFTRNLNKRYNEWLVKKYKTRTALAKAWTDNKGNCALKSNEDPTKGTVASSTLGSWGEAFTNYTTSFTSVDCAPRHADFMTFLMEIQTQTFTDFYKKARALGYKSAINCSNQPERAVDLYLNSLGDVMEKNTYWNHPQDNYTVPATFHTYEMSATDPRAIFGGDNFKTHNVGVVNRCSVADKPLVVTEWNTTSPSDFKADCLVQMAAYGAFQGWDGFCVFNYTFSGDSASFFSINGYTDFFTFCIDPATYAQFGQAAMLFRLGIVKEAKNSIELVMTKEDILAQNSDYYKAPQYLSYISKFSYRFIDGTYKGNADLVIPSGNTASGTYTNAKHLLMLSENIYSDPYNKTEGRTSWLKKHIQSASSEFKVGYLTFLLGKTAAVLKDDRNVYVGGGFYSGGTDLDEAATAVMRKFGLITDKQGYLDDAVVTDTGEITYTYDTNFKLETDRAVAFAGHTVTGAGGNTFGGCTLVTNNDRASVHVTSIDGSKAIKNASKINIFAMGRSTSTGLTWENKTAKSAKLTSLGTGPILVEDIRGTLTIPTNATKCTVYGLDSTGKRVKTVNAKAVQGGFAITLGGYVNYEVLMSDFKAESNNSSKPVTNTSTAASGYISAESSADITGSDESGALNPAPGETISDSSYLPGNVSEDRKESSNTALWIVLVILIGVLLIGGEAFAIYYFKVLKKKVIVPPTSEKDPPPQE